MIGLIYENTPNYGGIKEYSLRLFTGLSEKTSVELSSVPKIEFTIAGKKIGGWLSSSVLSRLKDYRAEITHATSHWVVNRNTDVATVHDLFPFTMPEIFEVTEGSRKFYSRAIEKLKAVDIIIVQSEYVKRDVEHYCPDSYIRVISTGVRKQPNGLRNPYPDDGRMHLFTMGEILQKNNRKRIGELYSYVSSMKGVDLYHIGRIEDKRFLNYAPNIHHVGENVSEAVKWSYLSYADRFVFYTHAEGQGIPALEAARAGTQPVLNDIPVHREFLGDRANYFTDRDSFGEAILAPVKSGLQERVARYDGWIDEYLKMYNGVRVNQWV